MKALVFGLVRMRGILLRIWIINLVSWTAWWTFLLYHTDWMGRTVFGGDPDGTDLQRDLYEAVRRSCCLTHVSCAGCWFM